MTYADIFDDFVNKEWTGHYMNSEDSNIVHQIKWEKTLDTKVIKEIKIAPEVSFEMHTYFYWNHGKKQIEFLSLDNKGNRGEGVVSTEKEILVYRGKFYYKNGENTFKKTFEIDSEGKLEDLFYIKRENSWIQRHHIEYLAH